MKSENEREQLLLQQLRAKGDASSLHQAAQLQKAYHDRNMAVLSADVYDSAKATGHPPFGWIRASEHPEMLRALAPHFI